MGRRRLNLQSGANMLYIAPTHRFVTVSPIYKPLNDGVENQIFISESYDATSHFETTCLDVLSIYRRGTGEDFDFSKVKHNLGDEDV